MRGGKTVEAFHEPGSRTVPDPQRPRTLNFVAADVRRLILFGANEVGASLRRLLRVHGPECTTVPIRHRGVIGLQPWSCHITRTRQKLVTFVGDDRETLWGSLVRVTEDTVAQLVWLNEVICWTSCVRPTVPLMLNDRFAPPGVKVSDGGRAPV